MRWHFASASQRTPPHAGHDSKVAFDLRRRCGFHHKHEDRSSPPKPRSGCEAQKPHAERQVRAGEGKVDFQIVDFAIKDQADLLVVGTHQRQGFHQLVHRSVSRGILRHAPMSVVCVPRSSHAVSTVRPCRRVLVATDLKEHSTHALA